MSPGVAVVVVGAGTLVAAVTAADVFLTVLFPASGRGPVRKPLSKLAWRGFQLCAQRISGPRRRDVLSYSGPVLILITITAWVVMLTVGWALIFWPMLGTQVQAAKGPTDRSLTAALYYSGYGLTTIGLGDLTPTTALARFLTVFESAIGFATVSMVITYFLSVYSALTRRRTRAALMHHATGGTARAADLVAAFADAGDTSGLREQLRSAGWFVQEICETHRSYPVLRYFHFRDPRYSLPRILMLAFGAASLVRACGAASVWPELRLIDGACEQLLDELIPEHRGDRWTDEQRRQAAEAFVEQWRDLAPLQLTSADKDAVRKRYLDERAEWEPALRALAAAMLYRWDEVDPPSSADRGQRRSAA